jgi:uncharacterized membrane protein YdjX (TVP38/TMEM64 family)
MTSGTKQNKTSEKQSRQITDRFHAIEEKALEKAAVQKSVAGHEMPAANLFKLGGLIAFFAIMAIACYIMWPFFKEIFEPGGATRVAEDVRNAGPWGFFILLAIQFLQVVVAFIPGEVVQITAGIIYGPWIGALIIWLGCIISSLFIYVLVNKLGAPFVQAMVPKKYMNKFREWEMSPKFTTLVFALYLIPGLPKDVFTYLTPLTHMPMRSFILVSNMARIPGIVLSTYAASGLVTGDIVQSVLIFGATALVSLISLIVYNRMMKKPKASPAKGQGEEAAASPSEAPKK